jgi:excisionase family DNA binding protein
MELQLASLSPLLTPLLTRERFAEQVGLTAPTVYAMADRGYLPTLHIGRRVFINVEALRLAAQKKAQEFTL